MNDLAQRRLYSRADIQTLKTYSRQSLFEALGSFEERGLSEGDFALRAAELLDPAKTLGLSNAMAAGNAAAVLDAVSAACRACMQESQRPAPSAGELQQARNILEHRFSFYDEPHQLPADIDWDFNPGTAHWAHDLNRFSFLSPLARAGLATGDARFGRKAVDLILDWIHKCDFEKAFRGTPYVFGSYLNQAIHCTAWAECLRLLLPADVLKPVELLCILKSLHDQLAYLEIVTNGHSGNWPTIGCQGILATLAVFPLFRDTDRFVSYCVRSLGEQIEEQVLPDGVQDELTPHYHRCVVDNLLSAVHSLNLLGRALEPRTLSRLRKMVHYLQQTVVPDRSAQVAFNDSDPAAVPDVASALAGAGLAEFLSPPEKLGPEFFPYAGVAFLRQRPCDGDLYLAFDGGPFGRAHQHEDKLGFWLFAYGHNFLVDPGRHLYDTSEVSFLSHLRSARAHSTITVDDQGQHSRGRREAWIPKAPVAFNWSIAEGEVRASAAYDLGYGEDNALVAVHRREMVFVKERFWVVFDWVEGQGKRRIDSRFQFGPCDLEWDGARAHTGFEDANLLLWSIGTKPFASVETRVGRKNPREGWYSRRYGLIEPAPCLVFSSDQELPFFAATLLFPYKGKDVPGVSFRLEKGHGAFSFRETGEIWIKSRQA